MKKIITLITVCFSLGGDIAFGVDNTVHLRQPPQSDIIVFGKAIKKYAEGNECSSTRGFYDHDAVMQYNDEGFIDNFTAKFSTNVIKKMFQEDNSSVSLWSSDENILSAVRKHDRDGLDAVKSFTSDKYNNIPLCLGGSSFDPPPLSDYEKDIPNGLYLWFSKDKYIRRKISYALYGMWDSYSKRYPFLFKNSLFSKHPVPFFYKRTKDSELSYQRYDEADLVYNSKDDYVYLVMGNFFKYCQKYGYDILGPPMRDKISLSVGIYRQEFEKGCLEWEEGGVGKTDAVLGITHHLTDCNGKIVPPSSCTDDNTCPGNQNNGKGGTYTQPDPSEQPASGKRPDFITSKVTMGNKDGKHEKYTWKINETAYVHDYIDNIGTADWWGSKDSIKVSFYLSKGSKEDSHSEWVRIGDRQNIKKENLKVKKDPKHEKIEFKLQNYANNGTVMPGRTYNFVVCADHPKDHNNNGGDVEEKHESNNCSTEAVFYVDYGPPRNVDLLARNLALTGGRSSLQAGEKYGLQVEVSNIGTEQPWNGFSTNYEIKGPGTGGVWQKIGEDTSRASSLYPNATHLESMSSEQEVSAPMVGGDYVFRACADYTQAVPETDESNNCTDELAVYIAPPPMPDLITEGLQLTHGRTSLIAGELYGLTVNVRNIGNATPSSYSYTKYEIKGPGTGDAWQKVAEDGTKTEHLIPGMTHWEEISDEEGLHIQTAPGTYTARACADYKGNIPESDEGNNCSEMTFEVQPVPAGSPTITVTNPTHDDEWRSDESKHIEWTSENFSSQERVKIEYSLDGGKTWDIVDDTAVNDGGKYWDMCEFHTEDTDDAFIRVTSLKYPYVYDDSDEFTIDHAAECE